MVYLRNNKFMEAESIVEWLQTQRQSDNGWVSTQVKAVPFEMCHANTDLKDTSYVWVKNNKKLTYSGHFVE